MQQHRCGCPKDYLRAESPMFRLSKFLSLNNNQGNFPASDLPSKGFCN